MICHMPVYLPSNVLVTLKCFVTLCSICSTSWVSNYVTKKGQTLPQIHSSRFVFWLFYSGIKSIFFYLHHISCHHMHHLSRHIIFSSFCQFDTPFSADARPGWSANNLYISAVHGRKFSEFGSKLKTLGHWTSKCRYSSLLPFTHLLPCTIKQQATASQSRTFPSLPL